MKYWLLTSEYPPFFGGGISTYCYFTAQMLLQHNHEVSVFVNDAAVNGIEVSHREGVRVIRFSPTRTNASSFLGHVTNISYEFAHVVKEFIAKEGRPDLIEAQEYLGIAYYLLQYKHLLYDWCVDVPVLITMHSPSFLYMEYNHVSLYRYPNYWIGEMERFCLQAADRVISPSAFILSELRKKFALTNTRLSIIPNPFSAKKFTAGEMENTGADQIVFFGKLSVQKGTFKLLAYFRELWDEGFSRPLYLLGGQDIVYHPEGKSMGDLVRSRHKQYMDQGLLILEDRIPPSGIPGRMARAEVVIVPSCNDNLPYVVFEMMALGKVLLVSRQGGQAEVIEDGVDGFVFDHAQPHTFGQQLKKILALSSAEKKAIGRNAQSKIAAVYGLDTIYAQKMEAIGTTLQQGGPGKAFPFIRPNARMEAVAEQPGEGKGLLSIVVPFYNMGNYVRETVASLMAVDYPEKEILIVNDGSNEAESMAVLAQFRTQPGIRVLDTPNRGLAHARNFGAGQAKGLFLAFLDADDKVEATYYSKAIRVLKAYENVHFAGGWTKYFEGSAQTWPTFTPEPPVILYHNTVNSSALVYKRAAFLQAGKNDADMAFQGLEDYDSVVSLLSKGYGGVVLPELLFQYRVRSNSMIRGISKAKKSLLYEHISKKHRDFYARFATDLFNLQNANGPGMMLDNPSLDLDLADRLPFGGKLAVRMVGWIKKNKYAKTIAYKAYRIINR